MFIGNDRPTLGTNDVLLTSGGGEAGFNIREIAMRFGNRTHVYEKEEWIHLTVGLITP